jgi:hypothetical protein
MSKPTLLIALLTLLSASSELLAQPDYYAFGFQQEYFRGIMPSARTEAMGKTDVALGGSITGTYNNPAAISTITNQELHLSTSAPFYVLHNSNYYYGGFARRINDKLVVGASVNSFHVGASPFELNVNGVDFPLDDIARTTNTALTGSYEVLKGLSLAANLNWYNWKNFEDVAGANSAYLDAGILYYYPIGDKTTFQTGVSFGNLTGSTITYSAPDGSEGINMFPRSLKGGIAFIHQTTIKLPKANEGNLQLTATAEYNDVVNTVVPEWLRGVNFGCEALAYDILAIRAGYRRHQTNNFNNPVNRSIISDITYGFGVVLPLQAIFKESLPFTTRFDYTSLEPASARVSGPRLANFRNFSLNLNWNENEE